MDPTSFRLMAASGGGSIPPVSISFTASNYYPAYGATVYLNWTVTNSGNVYISEIGSFSSSSGTTSVTGGNGTTRTFTLTTTGLDGLVYTASLSITWGVTNCPQAWINMGWC